MKKMVLGSLAAGLLTTTMAANAAIITYDFTVNGGPEGPLAGEEASGFFSYDDSIVVPGGFIGAVGLLTALSFAWNGITYDETTANTGGLRFDSEGNLSGALFGTNCSAGGCSISSVGLNWTVNSTLDEPAFRYSLQGEVYAGTVSVTLREATVPEPATLALLGLSLIGMGYARRRKAA